MNLHLIFPVGLILGLAIFPQTLQAAKKDKAEPALSAAAAQLARLEAAKDSVSRLRWNLRQSQMDAREVLQTQLDRVRDSLDQASAARSRALEDLRDVRSRPAEVKVGADPSVKKAEQLRQEMLDRSELLKDKIKYGIPWDQDDRLAALLRVTRGIESYPGVIEGIAPLFAAYRSEWDFSRQIEREEGEFPKASGGTALGSLARVGLLGAWYLTRENTAGILAKSGSGDLPYAWHENLLPATQRAIMTGIGSREMDLPVDPVQTQAAGPTYFKIQEVGFFHKLVDLKNGPLSKMPLFMARCILAILILLGIGIVIVYLRRRSLVRKEAADADEMRVKLFKALTHRESSDKVVSKADVHTVAGRIVRLGFDNMALSPESLEQLMVSQESVEERRLNRGLNFLGIVASNAAFIGLLGTVLGILDAFAHLGDGGADASLHVMAAIAEALIATAMGLAVAIPAVIFYNNLSHSVHEVIEEAKELRHLILAACLDTVARNPVKQKEEAYGG